MLKKKSCWTIMCSTMILTGPIQPALRKVDSVLRGKTTPITSSSVLPQGEDCQVTTNWRIVSSTRVQEDEHKERTVQYPSFKNAVCLLIQFDLSFTGFIQKCYGVKSNTNSIMLNHESCHLDVFNNESLNVGHTNPWILFWLPIPEPSIHLETNAFLTTKIGLPILFLDRFE